MMTPDDGLVTVAIVKKIIMRQNVKSNNKTRLLTHLKNLICLKIVYLL